MSALPDDPTFDQTNNKYDVASYNRICAEFGVSPSTDWRFTIGANHGLGNVYIYIARGGMISTDMTYPNPHGKFSDEGGTSADGDLIQFIRNDHGPDTQFEHFVLSKTLGLTPAGLLRMNQSIEAFVYCILGAQVNARSSIMGKGGRAKETQAEFLVLIEDAIRTPDISKSVQRFQLALDEAKVRLNFAVAPGAWLMPARMIINTESVVGDNNMLRQATKGMQLGVNDDVNTGTKSKCPLGYLL